MPLFLARDNVIAAPGTLWVASLGRLKCSGRRATYAMQAVCEEVKACAFQVVPPHLRPGVSAIGDNALPWVHSLLTDIALCLSWCEVTGNDDAHWVPAIQIVALLWLLTHAVGLRALWDVLAWL